MPRAAPRGSGTAADRSRRRSDCRSRSPAATRCRISLRDLEDRRPLQGADGVEIRCGVLGRGIFRGRRPQVRDSRRVRHASLMSREPWRPYKVPGLAPSSDAGSIGRFPASAGPPPARAKGYVGGRWSFCRTGPQPSGEGALRRPEGALGTPAGILQDRDIAPLFNFALGRALRLRLSALAFVAALSLGPGFGDPCPGHRASRFPGTRVRVHADNLVTPLVAHFLEMRGDTAVFIEDAAGPSGVWSLSSTR